MSDIDDEADRFHAMLEKIQFSPDDTLYILGDVIDRGPDGIPLLREIMATPNMVMLPGNHEYMMLDYMKPEPDTIAIRRWNKNGNRPTLDAYLKLKAKEQQEILDHLRSLSTHLEVEINGMRCMASQEKMSTTRSGTDRRLILRTRFPVDSLSSDIPRC